MNKWQSAILLAAVCGLAATDASAQLYKWVDASGAVHYGDKVPDSDKSRASIVEQGPPQSTGVEPGPTDWQASDNAFRARQAQREQQAALEERKKAEAAQRAKRCSDARASAARVESGVRMFKYDDQGNRAYMDDNQRNEVLQRAQDSISTNC